MRDLKVTQKLATEHDPTSWHIDIEISNGQPELVELASQTMDQRAALSTLMIRGTIPGKPNVGVDWSSFYGRDPTTSWIDIDNQMKQNIQDYASDPNNAGNSNIGKYYPIMDTGTEKTVKIQVINMGAMING